MKSLAFGKSAQVGVCIRIPHLSRSFCSSALSAETARKHNCSLAARTVWSVLIFMTKRRICDAHVLGGELCGHEHLASILDAKDSFALYPARKNSAALTLIRALVCFLGEYTISTAPGSQTARATAAAADKDAAGVPRRTTHCDSISRGSRHVCHTGGRTPMKMCELVENLCRAVMKKI